MGKRGTKPQPTALKIMRGNPGRRRQSGKEPEPASANAPRSAPEWLGDVGSEVWNEVAPQLFKAGLLTTVDERALALYCEAWQELHDARAEIEKGGMIAVSEKGGAYQHPAVGIKNSAILRIKQFGAEFGMTPSSRTSLHIDKQTISPKAKFFA